MNKISIKKVNNFDFPEWDDFIEKSNNGTVFHSLKFLKYHSKHRFNFLNLAFYDGGKIIALLTGEVKNDIFVSPQGASYGSFVVGDISFSEYERIIIAFLRYMKKLKIKRVFLTPPPIFYLNKQNEIEKFLLKYFGFKEEKSLISNAINIGSLRKDTSMDALTAAFKRSVRRSYKYKLNIRFSRDLKNFYDILLDNKKKFNVMPTHSLDELVYLMDKLPQQIRLLMCYAKSTPIAGLLLFLCNKNTVLTFYISHYYKFQEYRSVNRLLYECLLWCKKNKFKYLDLGVSMDTVSKNQMEPSRSLISFKEGLGTRGFQRTTFYLKLE